METVVSVVELQQKGRDKGDEKGERGGVPSTWLLEAASAYTLTQSSVPLGRTNARPESYFLTSSSINACTPAGLTSRRSASVVVNAFRSLTCTLTSLLGKSKYDASHSAGPQPRWMRIATMRSRSESESPTVWLMSFVNWVRCDRAVFCAGVLGWYVDRSWVNSGEKRTVPCPLASK